MAWPDLFFMLRRAFRERYPAVPLEAGLESRLQALWRTFGREGLLADFRVTFEPKDQVRIWAITPKKIEIYFSRGFIERVSDLELEQVLTRVAEASVRRIREENLREGLQILLEQWKGDSGTFRYWFWAFLLYPLERLLKIAKI